MLNRYLKNRFGKGDKDVPATDQFYSPLRIALHSTINLATVDMLVLSSALHPNFDIPQGSLSVLAIGEMEMQDIPMYRIYLQDSAGTEFILQIVEGKDFRTQEPTVDEIILFQQVTTIEPQSEDSLNRCLSNIGFTDIDLDNIVYERIWGDQFTEKLELTEVDERVVQPSGVSDYRNHYVLYGREVDHPVEDEPVTENLLVGIEEDEGNAQIAFQVGLKLNATDVSVQ